MLDKSAVRPTHLKEFTEKWLQALTLSVAHAQAQRIKPLISDIDSLSNYQDCDDRITVAQRFWDFATTEKLTGLLKFVPFRQPNWKFEDEDRFEFDLASANRELDLESWIDGLGLKPAKISLLAKVNRSDWTNLLRKELVRNGRALNMSSMPEGNNLSIPCTAEWDLEHWSIHFENPSWLTLKFDTRFRTERPSWNDVEETALWCMSEANESFVKKEAISSTNATETSWIESVPRFRELHRSVLEGNRHRFQPPFLRCWGCVWPVAYREQNKLRGPVDLQWIRTELEACFRNQPRLTVWMFAFSKLLCTLQLGGGLGIAGDFEA